MNHSSLIRKFPKMMRFKSHVFEDMAHLLPCVMETGGITGTRVGFTPSGGLSEFESAVVTVFSL